MDLRLHHIGIAVKELKEVEATLREKLGITFGPTEFVDSQKVNVTFSNLHPALELVEAGQEKSPAYPMLPHPVISFLKGERAGLHHICFAVKDMEAACAELKEKNVKILGNGIFTGSGGKKIVFIDPNETNGILIELKEDF